MSIINHEITQKSFSKQVEEQTNLPVPKEEKPTNLNPKQNGLQSNPMLQSKQMKTTIQDFVQVNGGENTVGIKKKEVRKEIPKSEDNVEFLSLEFDNMPADVDTNLLRKLYF